MFVIEYAVEEDASLTIEGRSRAKSWWQLVVFSQDLLGLLLVASVSKLLALYEGPVAGLGVSGRLWIWALAGRAAIRASKEPPEAPGDGDDDILPCGSSLPAL